jgi:hypothetical protein
MLGCVCRDKCDEMIGGVPKSNCIFSWQVVEFDGWELRVSEVCLYLCFLPCGQPNQDDYVKDAPQIVPHFDFQYWNNKISRFHLKNLSLWCLPLHFSCVTWNFHDGGKSRSNVHVMIISQSYLSALTAVVHPASSHYCRHIMLRILWYWRFFLQIYRSRCLRTFFYSVFVVQNHGVTMSHSTPSGNGCSLEDCYTNLFSLVSWMRFSQTKAVCTYLNVLCF